jgi:hypothetical protein
MPKRQQHWTGHCEYPLTDAYERGHEATFGAKPERYCQGCGRLPAFCGCRNLESRKRFFSKTRTTTARQGMETP